MMAQLIAITLLCLTSVFPKYAIKTTNLSLLKLFSTTRKKKIINILWIWPKTEKLPLVLYSILPFWDADGTQRRRSNSQRRHRCLDFHVPVWRRTRSGGGVAGAGCSPYRWSRRQPADGAPLGSRSRKCLSSCRRYGFRRPRRAMAAPGWASACPQIWSETLLLMTVRRENESIISSNRAALITFH